MTHKQLTIDGREAAKQQNNYLDKELQRINACTTIDALIDTLTRDKAEPTKRWLRDELKKTFTMTALNACKDKAKQSIINAHKPIN